MFLEAFKTVLQLGMMGSIMAVFIIIFKPVSEKFIGHKFQYYVWLPAMLTMTAFVFPSVIFDSWDVPDSINRFEGVKVIAKQTGQLLEAKTEIAGKSVSWLKIFSYLWILGLIGFGSGIFIKYNLFKKVLIKNSVILSCKNIKYVPMDCRLWWKKAL